MKYEITYVTLGKPSYRGTCKMYAKNKKEAKNNLRIAISERLGKKPTDIIIKTVK